MVPLRSRQRITKLIALIFVLTLGAALPGIYLLYHIAYGREGVRLSQMAQSQVRLIESVARFDALNSAGDDPGGSFGATLSQIAASHNSMGGFGETGEFTLARAQGGTVEFLLSLRHEGARRSGFEDQTMAAALAGKSGVLVAKDYRGVEVLAASEPVAVLDLGLVAKMDIAEIRRPFLQAALAITGLAFLLAFIGAFTARRVTEPLLKKLNSLVASLTDKNLKLQRETAERQVVEAEREKMRRLLEETLNEIYILDVATFRFLEANSRALENLGYSAAELARLCAYDIMPDLPRDDFRRAIAPLLDGETGPLVLKTQYQRRNATRYPVELHARLHDDGHHRVVILVAEDVTERKRAEDILRENEARFVASFNQAAVGIAHVDLYGTIMIANDEFCNLTGYERDELMAMDFRDLIHESDRYTDTDGINRLIAGEMANFSSEKRFILRHGELRYVMMTATLVRSVQGKPRYFITVLQDITARRMAEEAVAGHSMLLQSVTEAQSRFIASASLEGGEEEVFGRLLNAFCAFTNSPAGFIAEIIRGAHDAPPRLILRALHGLESWPAAVPGKTLHDAGPLLGGFLRDGKTRILNGVLAASDLPAGLPELHNLLLLPLGEDDGRIGFVALANRVPDYDGALADSLMPLLSTTSSLLDAWRTRALRYKAEMEIRTLNADLEQRVAERTAQLEASNRILKEATRNLQTTRDQLVESEKMAALGSLVAGVAHEINTPVGVGVTASSHLRQSLAALGEKHESSSLRRSELDAFIRDGMETADIILMNLMRASDLIRGFKQVAVDQISEDKRRFNVGEYIREVVTSLQPKLKSHHHVVDIHCDEPIELESYPGTYSQIITNLVMNSVIHGFEGRDNGRIAIEVRRVHTPNTNGLPGLSGDLLKLSYADDGRGIPAEDQKRVFEPFFTTKRGKGGSGLGLHILYNLVTRKLGGRVTLESRPGEGTAFTILLPAEKQEGIAA